jgi:predicted DNA-binding transcriptional regulator YafY
MGMLGKARGSGTPSRSTRRKIQFFVSLLRRHRISLDELKAEFGVSERTLLRDLQELRAIGEAAGFRISQRDGSDEVELADF